MRSFQNPLSDDFYKTRLHKRGKNRDSIFSRAVLLKSGKRREEEREEERERKREREKRYRRQEPVSPYFRFSSFRERSERLDIAPSRSNGLSGERVHDLIKIGTDSFFQSRCWWYVVGGWKGGQKTGQTPFLI